MLGDTQGGKTEWKCAVAETICLYINMLFSAAPDLPEEKIPVFHNTKTC